MRRVTHSLLLAAAVTLAACGAAPEGGEATETTDPLIAADACSGAGWELQVLGSGGPIAEASRAATSYLLWLNGEPKLLIDAGSGSFVRFAEAGGNIASLEAILMTHLHADHAGDLIDVLNSGGFEGRTEPLTIIGPDAAPRFPGMGVFLERLLGKDAGAFAYNGGYLDGTENKAPLVVREVVTNEGDGDPIIFILSEGLSVTAHPVNHGAAPALGYAITIDDRRIVITGDQSAFSERFLADLTGSSPNILFAHHVINGEPGQPRGLHRTPQEIGELARAIDPGLLVLTHNMERSLSRLEDSREAIALNFVGPVEVASDLACFGL